MKTIIYKAEVADVLLNGKAVEGYLISRDGRLFHSDKFGTYSQVEVTTSPTSKKQTQVLVNGVKRSLVTMMAENFRVSEPEARKIVESRYSGNYYPDSFEVSLQNHECNDSTLTQGVTNAFNS